MEKENQETTMKRPRSNTGRFSNKNNASNRLLAQQKLVEARRKCASSEFLVKTIKTNKFILRALVTTVLSTNNLTKTEVHRG